MDYLDKYIKYKTKYFNLKSNTYQCGGYEKPKNNKHAIFMLCMLKEHYVLGACITAYNHRQYINKTNRKIDLVIMCDDNIYTKYESTLKYYFDRVIKIELRVFDISKKYVFPSKYSWINYSLNKWKCLQYDEYDKILFLDIDMLTNNVLLYNIFDYDTPAFHIIYHKFDLDEERICLENQKLDFDTSLSYEEYTKQKSIISIDGGIMLLKPGKDIYDMYHEFTDDIYKDGIYSHVSTSPDETSLFYFYLKSKFKIRQICSENAVVPWEDKYKGYIEQARLYNFLSFIKPWTKPKFLCWVEEFLWHDLYDMMHHEGKIRELYKKSVVDGFLEYLKQDPYRQKRYYNLRFVRKYSDRVKEIEKSKDMYKGISKLSKKVFTKDYGLLNRKKNSFDNIIPIK